MRLYRLSLPTLVFWLAVLPAAAWTPETQLVIAAEAARLAPPDLYRQIDRHRDEFQAGVLAPFSEAPAEQHVQTRDGGALVATLLAESEAAVEAIRQHRPFAEVVYRLGVVCHYLADANNPLNVSDADPREPGYFSDYLFYLHSAEPRLPRLFYGLAPGLERMPSLAPVVAEALERGRDVYPLVGREYRRIGFASGSERFDDRSTAFGTASLSFSHAVTDAAQGLIWIWVAAGGHDPRTGLPERGDRILLLPPAPPVE